MKHNLDYVTSLVTGYESAEIDRTISPRDAMNDQWYFDVGRYAVETILVACASARIRDVKRVLDLPCGHGRVTRHLAKLFPGADLFACDLDPDGADYCAKQFGARAIHSKENLLELDLPKELDIIWVGSLFTHTARDVTQKWAAHLTRFLSPQGIIVATLHGRWAELLHVHGPQYIDEKNWQKILDGFERSGYGYADYPHNTHTYIRGSYGVSLVRPHIAMEDIEEIAGVRIHLYRERGWGDNHDVIVFGRPAYDDLWAGMPADRVAEAHRARQGRRLRRDGASLEHRSGRAHESGAPHFAAEARDGSRLPGDESGRASSGPLIAAFDQPAVRLIAFHLPQFHPLEENDRWWGKGFTEWTNVARAKPLFRGHYQPRLPADLGYYDLRVPETRQAQAELARSYGIEGFCYWHYWFHGNRLLERPVNEILASGEPDFPFCLAWANESWSRSWLGDEREILIEQEYSERDDRAHARWLASAFADPRYIHVNGRPMLVVYKPLSLPDAKRTTDVFREECCKLGGPEPYLVGIDAHCPGTDMRQLGFDMTEHHEPQLGAIGPDAFDDRLRHTKLARNLTHGVFSPGLKLYSHRKSVKLMARVRPAFPHFPCCFTGWDNTARRGRHAIVMVDSDPEVFRSQLSLMTTGVLDKEREDRVVFINAWNEWAEGMYLEPDEKFGHAYLAVVADVLGTLQAPHGSARENERTRAVVY
jgi:SAM-dependent methyltransferase